MVKEYLKHAAEGLAFVLLVNLLVRADLVSAIAFLGALAYAYGQKLFSEREFQKETASKLEEQSRRIDAMVAHATESGAVVEQLKAEQQQVTKLAADTKRLLSDSNLHAAFVPRAKRNQPNV